MHEGIDGGGRAVEDSWVYHCPELCKPVLHDNLPTLVKATSRWPDLAHVKISQSLLCPYSRHSCGMDDFKSSLLTSFPFFLQGHLRPPGVGPTRTIPEFGKLSLQLSGDTRTAGNWIFVKLLKRKLKTKYGCDAKMLHTVRVVTVQCAFTILPYYSNLKRTFMFNPSVSVPCYGWFPWWEFRKLHPVAIMLQYDTLSL